MTITTGERLDVGEYWPVESRGESAADLLDQLRAMNWWVSPDASALVASLPPTSTLPKGLIKLSAIAATACEATNRTTDAFVALSRARQYRMATPEVALLLARQYPMRKLGASYIVVMHTPVQVPSESGRYRQRLLAISAEHGRVGIAAPRAKSERPWNGDRIFIFLSPE